MMSKGATVRWVALGGIIALSAAPQVLAKPLGSETCKVLKAEYAALRQQGVLKTMKNGPQWAKTNLSEDELARIKRYLMLQDHIKFRCFKGQKKIVPDVAKKSTGKPPDRVPLPVRKQVRQQPVEPVELDMEAIRDSLHGYQDADQSPAPKESARPKGQRGGDGTSGDASGAIEPKPSQVIFEPSRSAKLATQPQPRPVAYTVTIRELTAEDLAASAGVASRRAAHPRVCAAQSERDGHGRRCTKQKLLACDA